MNAADNSGAKRFRVIGVPGKLGRIATVGQVVRCSVQGAVPNGAVTDKEMVNVLIVRTKKEVRRKDGTYVRFDDNAGVVIDKQGLPLGTRIMGPIGKEVKDEGYTKIGSLAREVV